MLYHILSECDIRCMLYHILYSIFYLKNTPLNMDRSLASVRKLNSVLQLFQIINLSSWIPPVFSEISPG